MHAIWQPNRHSRRPHRQFVWEYSISSHSSRGQVNHSGTRECSAWAQSASSTGKAWDESRPGGMLQLSRCLPPNGLQLCRGVPTLRNIGLMTESSPQCIYIFEVCLDVLHHVMRLNTWQEKSVFSEEMHLTNPSKPSPSLSMKL